MSQEKLLFSDLPALDSSPESVRQAFTDRFKVKPDGIALNNETYFGGYQPPITVTYGYPCYKRLGKISYSNGSNKPPSSVVVGSNVAVNHSDDPATMTLEVEGSWTNEQTWSSESTTELSFSAGISIGGVFESGTEFSVSTTVGESKTESESRTIRTTIQVTIPPRSKQKVAMIGTLIKEAVNFSAPITVSGSFGANFPKRVEDHYFWFMDASKVLKKTTGQITGTIKNSSVFDVHTEIGKAEPLTSQEIAEFALLTQ